MAASIREVFFLLERLSHLIIINEKWKMKIPIYIELSETILQ